MHHVYYLKGITLEIFKSCKPSEMDRILFIEQTYHEISYPISNIITQIYQCIFVAQIYGDFKRAFSYKEVFFLSCIFF